MAMIFSNQILPYRRLVIDLPIGYVIILQRTRVANIKMSVRTTIISQIEQIALDEHKKVPPLRDDLVLLESGLDSLCFAILVSRLEDTLGLDPFSASEQVYYPTTLGEFIKFYETAAS
jgi:acyl carrier protein